MAIINLEMIGQMIADHDRDRRSQDFEKVIMSDCGSQFGKMIVSDRGSQKKWSNPSLIELGWIGFDLHGFWSFLVLIRQVESQGSRYIQFRLG